MPRPTKYSQVTADRILQALKAGNTRTASALYVGIDRGTLADWIESKPAFNHAVAQAEAEVEVRCVAQIAKAINEGNTHDAWKWLERRRSDDWRERKTQELTGPGGGDLVFTLKLGDAEPTELDVPAA